MRIESTNPSPYVNQLREDDVKVGNGHQAAQSAAVPTPLDLPQVPPGSKFRLPAAAKDVRPDDYKSAISKLAGDGTFNVAQFYQLLLKFAQNERTAAHQARVLERVGAESLIKAASDKIRTSAILTLTGGVVGGGMSAVGGLVETVGAVGGLKAATKGAETAETNLKATTEVEGGKVGSTPLEKGATDVELRTETDQLTKTRVSQSEEAEIGDKSDGKKVQVDKDKDRIVEILDRLVKNEGQRKADAIMRLAGGVNSMMRGTGEGVQSIFQGSAKLVEADGKDIEAESQRVQQLGSNEGEFRNDFASLEKDVIEKASQFLQARENTVHTIVNA